MYILTVTRGPDAGKQARVEPGRPVHVGSGEGSTLRLTDPKVLEPHCIVEIVDGAAYVINKTANAGTFIGEQKVTRAPLPANSAFRVGDSVVMLKPAPKGAAPAPEADPLVGKILGGYHVKAVIGRGGMGTVYRATQLSLHRDVAFKVLSPDLARDVAFRDLFINEARAAGQLVHPNVVQVYDAGTEGDHSYFSMELIGQGSVEEILEKRGKLPWQEAILMVLDAAHGLEYAEKKQIVHRDVKPDNLMLNDDGRVKIADLGLAKRGEGKPGDEGIIGTPHFIPPEQALGKHVDSRADIYSLGATFFRMITGKTLFSGKTAKEIVLKHIKEPAPAASSVLDDIPAELDLLLAKMLAKEPEQRYENARALITAIEEICAEHGIKGAVIRRGVGKKVMVPLVLLLLVAGGVVIWLATRPKEEDLESKRLAELRERQRIEAERQKEEAIRSSNAKERLSRAEGQLKDLQIKRLDKGNQTPLDQTYDEVDTSQRLESEWLGLADEFEKFAETAEAKEFGKDGEAKDAAQAIRDRLKALKETKDDRKKQFDQKFLDVQKKRLDLEGELTRLVQEAHYAAAYNLAERAARSESGKEDPFYDILQWNWVNPLDAKDTVPAANNPRIKNEIERARKFFGDRQKRIPEEAQEYWNRLRERHEKLGEGAGEEEIGKLIEDLRVVETAFGDPDHPAPPVDALVVNARNLRLQLENRLKDEASRRLSEDRLLLFRRLPRIRTLNQDAPDNLLMNVDLDKAIAEYTRLQEELHTPLYKRFVADRIRAVRWIEWLFAKFKSDVYQTVQKKEGAPLRSLDLELPTDDRRLVRGRFDKPTAAIAEFSFAPTVNNRVKRFSAFPMDWVYHACFLHEGELRWVEAERKEALRFALAIFCFETFQFEESRALFESLKDDERYGAAAKSLGGRAAWEASAKAEYLELMKAIDESKGRQALQDRLKQLLNFPVNHKTTLMLLDVLPRSTTKVSDDFASADEAPIPDAPPPPPLPGD